MTNMEHCPFCKIVKKELPTRLIHEDELALAFEDLHAQAPVHVLIIPKRHITSMNEVQDADGELMAHLLLVARRVAESLKVQHNGYRLVINTNAQAGQTVFHLHLHLLAGRAMGWPPG
jgi:histidine triad (HIT) family protein